MPAVPGGRPARPAAGIRAGRHCPRQRRGRARGHRPGPLRNAPPRSSPAGPALSSRFRGQAAAGRGLPSPAGRGPGLTRRAERSVRRRGPTDGPPPGTPTAPGWPPATPADEPGNPCDTLLTIDEVIAELRVSRAAFYRWRGQGAAPPTVRLPGGGIRVPGSALTLWLRRLEEQDTQDG